MLLSHKTIDFTGRFFILQKGLNSSKIQLLQKLK